MHHAPQQAPYDQPPHPLHHLALVLGLALFALLQHVAPHEPRLAQYLPLVARRLLRARVRLLAILVALANGTWRAPRRRTPSPRARTAAPAPYLPRRRGWLCHVTDHHVRAHAGQIEATLNSPETTRLLAAAPASARAALAHALRGPARLLALDLPSPLQRPGPPKPPRKRLPSFRHRGGSTEGGLAENPRPQGVLPTDRPIPKNVLAFARYNRRRFGKGG